MPCRTFQHDIDYQTDTRNRLISTVSPPIQHSTTRLSNTALLSHPTGNTGNTGDTGCTGNTEYPGDTGCPEETGPSKYREFIPKKRCDKFPATYGAPVTILNLRAHFSGQVRHVFTISWRTASFALESSH